MKKIFLLLTFSLFAFACLHAQGGNAFFSIPGNMAFTMTVNQKPVNNFPARYLLLSGMPAGLYNAQVTVLMPGSAPVIFSGDFSVANGVENGYYIQMSGGSFVFMLSESAPAGNAQHAMHPCFRYNAASAKLAGFSFAQTPTSFNPAADPWDNNNGWKSLTPVAAPNSGVTSKPVTNPAPSGNNPAPAVSNPAPAGNAPIAAPCYPPMPNDAFAPAQARVRAKPLESAKLAIAEDILENGCFTCGQIGMLLNELQTETSRIEAAKLAWHHCSDPANWSIVYDVFDMGSSIEDVKHYVKAHPYAQNNPNTNVQPQVQVQVQTQQTPPPPPPPPAPVPAPVLVSAVQGYNGPVGCEWPMEPGPFATLKQSLISKSFASTQMTVLKQAIPAQRCITVGQVKDLMGIFSFESDKLECAKFCWNYVYDINNYFLVNDAFTFSSTLEDLDKYLNANPRNGIGMIGQPLQPRNAGGGNAPAQPMQMDPASFNNLKNSINKQLSPSSKISVLKQGLASQYPSTAQTKELMAMFMSDYDRLDVAKICWHKVTDPANYFMVNDQFSFSSRVKELEAYMKANPR